MAVVYAATMSLDGYIAGPGGDMQWLVPYLGANPEAEELARRTGALLIGARTLFGDDPHRGTDREGAFGGTWDGPSFVLTHTPHAEPVPGGTNVRLQPLNVTPLDQVTNLWMRVVR